MFRSLHLRLTALRLGAVAGAAVLLAACSEGQPVDAGGERGGGGLAFVLLALFVVLFAASMFYMDNVRKRRSGRDD